MLTTEQSQPRDPEEIARDVLSLEDLMRLTGWGRTYCYSGAKANTLPIPTLRAGNRYYFSRAAYERWLNGEPRDGEE